MPGNVAPKSAEMALRGRIGGYRTQATHNPQDTTAKARATFLASFEDQVDPERALSAEERQRRATAARKAHMARLTHASIRARRARSAQRERVAA